MDVSIWINKILESFQSCDINIVVKLLSSAKISSKGDIYLIVGKQVREVVEGESGQQAFIEFASNYAMYMLHKQERTLILKAFSNLNQSIKAYSKFYQCQVLSGSWSVPLIDHLCKTLKELSYLAESEYKKSKEE